MPRYWSEQETEKLPEARWLMINHGMGALTVLAFVLISGEPIGFSAANRSRAIWDWRRWSTRAGSSGDWGGSPNREISML